MIGTASNSISQRSLHSIRRVQRETNVTPKTEKYNFLSNRHFIRRICQKTGHQIFPRKSSELLNTRGYLTKALIPNMYSCHIFCWKISASNNNSNRRGSGRTWDESTETGWNGVRLREPYNSGFLLAGEMQFFSCPQHSRPLSRQGLS